MIDLDEIKAIVWDIGGVILSDPEYKEFWKGITTAEEIRDFFGRGKMSINEFVKLSSQLFNITEDKFLEIYKKVYCNIKKNKTIFEIYSSIKCKRFILSDTNPIHLKYLYEAFPEVFELAEQTFASPEIGIRKKNPLIYDLVIEKTGFSPEEIILVDNKQSILDVAAMKRINTILFENSKSLKEDLIKFGVDL